MTEEQAPEKIWLCVQRDTEGHPFSDRQNLDDPWPGDIEYVRADLDKANARVAELEAELRQSKCEAVSYLGQLYDAQGWALAAEARVAELEAQIEGLLKIVHSDHKAFCQTEEAAARPYKYR